MNAKPDMPNTMSSRLETSSRPATLSREGIIHLHQQGDRRTAYRAYVHYLAQRPDDAGMWANLGVLLRQQQNYAVAIGCYRRALALKPDDAGILSNFGNVLKDCDRLEEAVACQQRAVMLAPDNNTVRLNLAVSLREAKLFTESLVQLNLLLQQQPNHAGYRWERALVNLYLGKFKQGWEDYEARWQTGELPQVDYGCPRWQGENLDQKNLLLIAEQGYGDTILAARFIPLIQQRYPQCNITLHCKPELHRLFANLDVSLVATVDAGNTAPHYYSPLMSLMGIFNIDDSNVPPPAPLHIPAEAKNKFSWLQQHAPGKKKIGMVWSGSLTFKDNAKRSAGLEQFLPLAENPALQLYSFQKGARQQDLHTHGAVPLLHDLSHQLDDFADTAAAVEHMDMIVMTDSSLAHLAASLNKPVINLLQYKPYWLYATDQRMQAWYPAMQAIRQEKAGDWQDVFEAARQLIKYLLQRR